MGNVTEMRNARGERLFNYMIAMEVITIVFPLLRLWSRMVVCSAKGNRRRLWWDDWLCLASVPFSMSAYALMQYSTVVGLGLHVWELPVENQQEAIKAATAQYPVWIIGMLFIKLSALCFYARVLTTGSRKTFHISLWVTATIVVVFAIFAIIYQFTSCNPVEKAWMWSLKGECRPQAEWWMGSSSAAMIIDLVIVLLPIPVLWELQLPFWRKIGLIVIFFFGYISMAATIGRVVTLYKNQDGINHDLTYALINVHFWAESWPAFAIISICFPSIFCLAQRAARCGPRALFSSQEAGSFNNSHNNWFGSSSSTNNNRSPSTSEKSSSSRNGSIAKKQHSALYKDGYADGFADGASKKSPYVISRPLQSSSSSAFGPFGESDQTLHETAAPAAVPPMQIRKHIDIVQTSSV